MQSIDKLFARGSADRLGRAGRLVVVLVLLSCGCANRTAERKAAADEFEELRGAELARAVEMYREGRMAEGRRLLRDLVADDNWNVRSNAIRAIGDVGDSGLLPEVHAALEDERLEVRESTSRILQWLGDQSSIPFLQGALSDPEPIVRSNAAEALVRIGGVSAVGLLAEVLKTDADPSVRAITASALGRIPEPDVVRALIAALSDDFAMVRVRAAVALGEIGDPSARPALEKAANDPELQVRRSAKEALKRLATD